MDYQTIREEILKEMHLDLLAINTADNKQKLIAEKSYLLGRLVKAELKLKDQSTLIRGLRKY